MTLIRGVIWGPLLTIRKMRSTVATLDHCTGFDVTIQRTLVRVVLKTDGPHEGKVSGLSVNDGP